jgi:NAD(P)-dependent dehydrogenase (short-subunit alcohol dehydrogenase family)
MDLGLTNRTVLVTGGSAGVGLETVRLLVGEGAHVATCARDGEVLRRAVSAVVPGSNVLTMPCDVRNADAVGLLAKEAVATFGGLDALVLNAGQGSRGDLASTTDEEWRAEFEMKIFGCPAPAPRCNASPRALRCGASGHRQRSDREAS